MLRLKRGNPQQTKAGDFFRVGLQRFVGQRLHLRGEMLVAGEIQRLRPLPQQLGRSSGQCHRTLEHPCCIAGTILRHVAARQKIQVLGRIRLGLHAALKALGHVGQRGWRLGEFAAQPDPVTGAQMQIAHKAEQRHQHSGQQQHRLAQPGGANGFCAFGVGKQLSGSLGAGVL
ncbi:hypothetical protein KPSA1_02515 [Pseudomonas syringae pv. actinidiae]|uniref:Uncharacterized protein n=1 Tax=Pseudomonas syringae pv. actinidiae TaxID=103796 RepID=A0A2V0Q8R3_PSESF|nr:hypothetical protein KPSA1_02515 [Pseudomonas syringae pv. actinidiae]